jgi:hypothetical protein
MPRVASALAVLGASLVFVTAPAAAQDRAELIRQADLNYQNFQTGRALDNLKAALDPTRGEPDSLWGFGVHLLAQIYWEQGDTTMATAWLRWAMRSQLSVRIDSSKFLPEVLAASGAARQWVRRTEGEGDFVTETRFEWPTGPRVETTGSLLIENAGLGIPLRVIVQGRQVQEGRTTTGLSPGSVEVQAAADGYLATRVTREILPGVTTVLKFNLQTIGAAAAGPPTVVDPLFGQLRARSARLSLWRNRRGPTCATGFYVGASLFVTTYEAIKGADSAVVTRSDGMRIENRVLRVAAYDTVANVAVLKLPAARDSLLLSAALTRRGQWVFPMAFTDCTSATINSRAVRVALGDDPIELAESTTGAQFGAALVDSTGAVLGLTFRGDRAIPASTVAGVVSQARQRDRLGQLQTLAAVALQSGHGERPGQVVAGGPAQVQPQKKGGFPVAIVLGGLVAAGGGAALLLLGGGGDGGTTSTTGSILVRFPNQ